MTPKQPYPQYACQQAYPLTCNIPTEKTGKCSICKFPAALAPKAKINGQNQYEIIDFKGLRGNGRLYGAINLTDQSSCVIKEYLLPQQAFTPQEVKERRDTFLQRISIGLADGRVQNFRLLLPVEAIVSDQPLSSAPLSSSSQISSATAERYFLVYGDPASSVITLRQYLKEESPLTLLSTRSILSQILQSLEFMHQQQFRWHSGQAQAGLIHGNLNLDSILIVDQPSGRLVYLCDFHFWEQLFSSPLDPPVHASIAQDLQGVGQLALCLYTDQPEKLFVEDHSPLDIPLRSDLPIADRDFVYQLLGTTSSSFTTAEQARKALLQFPPLERSELSLDPVLTPEPTQSHHFRFRWWMGLAFIYLVLASMGLGWLWFKHQSKPSVAQEITLCCIEQIASVPTGPIQYSAEKQGTWDYIFTQPHLLRRNTTFKQELEKAQVLLKTWKYHPTLVIGDAKSSQQPQLSDVQTSPTSQLNSETTDFVITSLTNDIDPALGVQPFAYNGIAVFVAFGYDQRQNSLPNSLNGKITLKQLRELYTGKITNWRQIDRDAPDRPVKLYFPSQNELLRIFENRVLVDQQSIAAFRDLMAAEKFKTINDKGQRCGKSACSFASTTLQLRAVIEDFEDQNAFSIGFDVLNKIVNQCSVYPLAIAATGKKAVSPFVLPKNLPITPATDLCNAKASYSINYQALQTQSYPLSFPLSVVYFRDNRRQPVGQRFADILRTQEAQCWLKKTGLAPHRTLSRSDCKSSPRTP